MKSGNLANTLELMNAFMFYRSFCGCASMALSTQSKTTRSHEICRAFFTIQTCAIQSSSLCVAGLQKLVDIINDVDYKNTSYSTTSCGIFLTAVHYRKRWRQYCLYCLPVTILISNLNNKAVSKIRGCIFNRPITMQQGGKGCPHSKGCPLLQMQPTNVCVLPYPIIHCAAKLKRSKNC